ncbi:hypothetical protein [Neorhizobium galegae]|uniref:hypothetical protein n=1 Tax=Neorhizobium galegae TaxID=399 RepID=UPI002103A97D|nr:hypothetical protein [Neorhizobium galegae]MCQ1850389.1 hypothetical protein [Neorhizobium galegae]
MLKMEQTELAERSGVSLGTIRRLEGLNGVINAQESTLQNIRGALEAAGVLFVAASERSEAGGAGVRLNRDTSADEWNKKVDEILSSIPRALHRSDYENIATSYTQSINSERVISPEDIEAVASKLLELAAGRLLREPDSHGGLHDLMKPPEGNPEDTHQKKRFRIPIYDKLVGAIENAAERKGEEIRDLDEKIESAKAKRRKQDE